MTAETSTLPPLPPLPPLPKPTAKPKPAPKAKQLPAPKPLPAKPVEELHYSEDAELCALGAMLIDTYAAKCTIEDLRVSDFYLGKHRIIFDAMSELFTRAQYLDEVSVCDELIKRNALDQAGGRDYIGRLIVKTPGAAGWEEYIRIILEHSQKRQVLEVARLILKSGSLTEAKALIDGISERKAVTVYSWGDAVRFDTENDPNTILGHRWLSAGGSCLWVGSTGMGKSSLIAQAAATWAIGEPLFGIKPTRPLRSLIIQAENDEGDIAEITRGVTNGLHMTHLLDQLHENIKFAEKTAVAGDAFMPYARRLIEVYKPDLLWIDPLFAFCGCDVSDQGAMSKFLRLGLQKIAQDTGVCNMVVHHTNKPKAPAPGTISTPGDEVYSGSGTAELSNWARAVMRIKRIPSGDFELIAAKRGRRAGLRDSQGKHTESVFLKHAPFPDIYWLPAVEPENAKDVGESADINECVSTMEDGKFYTRAELRNHCASKLDINESYMRNPNKRGGRIFAAVEAKTKDPTQMDFYRKKP